MSARDIGPVLLSLWIIVWLGVAWRRARGTTLRAPLAWAMFSTFALLACRIFVRDGVHVTQSEAAWAEWMQYLAAVTTFCPVMGVLGAKRPQDRGWQFIVATLWIVLALPAWQRGLLASAQRLEMHAAWRGFLIILILIGLANYALTRYGISAIAFAAAQWLWLRPAFDATAPAGPQIIGNAPWWCAALSVTLAAGCGLLGSWKPRGWDRVWRDFRDAYGSVWALRLAERVNQVATQEKLPLRLTWFGFVSTGSAERTTVQSMPAPARIALTTALRRFVSQEWVEQRTAE
jgi:hypothetical protein